MPSQDVSGRRIISYTRRKTYHLRQTEQPQGETLTPCLMMTSSQLPHVRVVVRSSSGVAGVALTVDAGVARRTAFSIAAPTPASKDACRSEAVALIDMGESARRLDCHVAPGRTVGAAVAGAARPASLSAVAADGWGVRNLAAVGGD